MAEQTLQTDARLGRWFAPDPMHQMHTPYAAMGNNPISMVDPTGGEYDEVKAYGANAAKFNWGHDGGVTYEVDGMIVSEFAYNNIVASGGGKNVQKMTYGGLAVGTTLGYSFNGQNYYGSHGYANAAKAQQEAFASAGLFSTMVPTGNEVLASYNDYAKYGQASTSQGNLGMTFVPETESLGDALMRGNDKEFAQKDFTYTHNVNNHVQWVDHAPGYSEKKDRMASKTISLQVNQIPSLAAYITAKQNQGNNVTLLINGIDVRGGDMSDINYSINIGGNQYNYSFRAGNTGGQGTQVLNGQGRIMVSPTDQINVQINKSVWYNDGANVYDGCEFFRIRIRAEVTPR